MTVYDLIDYIRDDTQVEVYLLEEYKTLFSGDVYDIPEHLKSFEISTIEVNENKLVINI